MNYIKEITAFTDWLVWNPLPTSAIALWYQIMAINNKCGWADEFTVANLQLQSLSGLSRQGVESARNVLVQRGRISYKKGNGNHAGKYRVIPFDGNILGTALGTPPYTNPAQDHAQTRHNTSTLYKQETKLNNIDSVGTAAAAQPAPSSVSDKKESPERPSKISSPQVAPGPPRFKAPELAEVVDYFAQQGGQVKEAEKFLDHYTANGWKVGKVPMKNWQAAARNWMKNTHDWAISKGQAPATNHQPPRLDITRHAQEQATKIRR